MSGLFKFINRIHTGFFSIAVFLIFCHNIHSQDISKGIILDANYCGLNSPIYGISIGDGYSNKSNILSISPGVFLRKRYTHRRGYSLESRIILKGYNLDYGLEQQLEKYRLLYFQNALHFDYYFWNKFFMSAGPEIGFMVYHKWDSSLKPLETIPPKHFWYEVSGSLGFTYSAFEYMDFSIKGSYGLTPVSMYPAILVNIFGTPTISLNPIGERNYLIQFSMKYEINETTISKIKAMNPFGGKKGLE